MSTHTFYPLSIMTGYASLKSVRGIKGASSRCHSKVTPLKMGLGPPEEGDLVCMWVYLSVCMTCLSPPTTFQALHIKTSEKYLQLQEHWYSHLPVGAVAVKSTFRTYMSICSILSVEYRVWAKCKCMLINPKASQVIVDATFGVPFVYFLIPDWSTQSI